MKTFDALVIEVNKFDVIQSLLDEVACVIIDSAARMIADGSQELFERLPVENLLARMQLKPNIDAGCVKRVENRRSLVRASLWRFEGFYPAILQCANLASSNLVATIRIICLSNCQMSSLADVNILSIFPDSVLWAVLCTDSSHKR